MVWHGTGRLLQYVGSQAGFIQPARQARGGQSRIRPVDGVDIRVASDGAILFQRAVQSAERRKCGGDLQPEGGTHWLARQGRPPGCQPRLRLSRSLKEACPAGQ